MGRAKKKTQIKIEKDKMKELFELNKWIMAKNDEIFKKVETIQ